MQMQLLFLVIVILHFYWLYWW